jgi:DNA-directed RNA polymerase subunit RPC12/RpoP
MQPFVCPQCGHQTTYDPWAGPARCPRCDFTPAGERMSGEYIQWAQRQGHQPYLDELRSHWDGSHIADANFGLESQEDALAFFRQYRQAMGEDPRPRPGPWAQYARDYAPTREEILMFAAAYLYLRHGERDQAAEELAALTFVAPRFVDGWVWRTAATADPRERLHYLHKASSMDLGHPLARDALALAEGRVTEERERQQDQLVVTQCPRCGAGLRYEPSATELTCAHCGHHIPLEQAELLDGAARPLHQLRLERRFQGHTWSEARRIVRCRTCSAELTMSGFLSRVCAFCGSTHVLVEDNRRILEQPDGLLPFQLDEEQARVALNRALSRLSRRLLSWLNGQRLAVFDLTGAYLPFWVFDGLVEAYRINTGIAGSHKESLGLTAYENLLLPAVDEPPPALLVKIYPFRLGTLAPYEPQLLASWPAKLYNQDVELVSEEARNAMVHSARRTMALRALEPSSAVRAGRRPLTAHDVSVPSQVAFQVVSTTYQLILLPVWLARLQGSDGLGLALVNGQNGRVALPAEVLEE